MSVENQEEVISRLKFIGRIEKDEKINTRHVNRQPDSLFTRISRTLIYPDNRNNTLKFSRDVINRTFEIIQVKKIENDNIKGLVKDLEQAKNGLLNLKHTYSDDTKFGCDIEVLVEQITSKLEIIQSGCG